VNELVSILMPAYKAQTFIHHSVRSLLSQTVASWELVIIADDGHDYARSLFHHGIQDARIRHVTTAGVGTGAANARNQGLSQARGRLIALLDSDDLFDARKLELMVPAAERHALACCALRAVSLLSDGSHEELGLLKRPAVPSGLLRADQVFPTCFSTHTMLVYDRQRITHGWQPEVTLLEDQYFTARALDTAQAAYYFDAPLHSYVKQQTALTSASDVSTKYIALKERLLAESDASCGPGVLAYREFLRHSLEAEKAYAADPTIEKSGINFGFYLQEFLERQGPPSAPR
jgi:glycosyltransferase involved in cell wall biosynthesis